MDGAKGTPKKAKGFRSLRVQSEMFRRVAN